MLSDKLSFEKNNQKPQTPPDNFTNCNENEKEVN